MRKRLPATMFAALVATAPIGSGSGAAELHGPMSSGKIIEAVAATPVAESTPTPAQAPASAATTGFDVEKLFAGTCGWCHSNAGRTAGKGPRLMGTALTDAEILYRIKVGKPGAMPAFGTAFTDDQKLAIVKYIRELRDEGTTQ